MAKIIASVSRESTRGFSTGYYVKESSPIKSVTDIKGKIVGINGFMTSGHLWLRAALEKNGLTDSDVTIAPVPFPACRRRSRRARSTWPCCRNHSPPWRNGR
jgi:ABC-type nitrate/sulfonate/bicarbonate transport system substrate-binding protein